MEGRRVGKEGRRKETKKERRSKDETKKGRKEGGKCAQTGANRLSVHAARPSEAASLRATRLVSFDV